jgi:FkbM family methyltransferase
MNVMTPFASAEEQARCTQEIRLRLDRLLSESMESVLERERDSLDQKIGSLDKEFVLFGAGNLGRKALKALRRIGKEPAAFIDNNPALWGTELLGVKVMSPAECAAQGDAASIGVITTIWCGEATDKMSDRIGPLRKLGFANIALFGHLAWKFPDVFLPHYCLDRPSKVIEQAAPIKAAFALLSDDDSRKLFVDHVEWRLFLDYDILPFPEKEEIYFDKKFVGMSPAEVVYDVGAYIGDSVESFLRTERGRVFSQVHSFEPALGNFLKLQEYVSTLGVLQDRIFAHRLALGDQIGSIQVEKEHSPAARVGRGEDTVAATTIDAFGESFAPPTFIKIDIEGFEPQCLAGARRTISENAPVIAVCIYHLQSHLWDILLQLHDYSPGYRYQFGPHLADGWDLVLYAVPKHRFPT